MIIRDRWGKTTGGRLVRLFSRRDIKRIFAVVLLQIFLGFFDLVGVAAIGILGALSVSGIQSQTPGNRVNSALKFLHISEFSFQSQVGIIGLSAALVLIGKTIFSVFITRKTLFFLSKRASQISSDLVYKFLSQPLLSIQSRSNQQIIYSVTNGVSAIALGIVGTSVSLIADISLLLVMSVGLIIVDPIVAAGTFLLFYIVGYKMYRLMNIRAKSLGKKNWELSVKGDEKVVEAVNSYRELVVRNRRNYYAREISKVRFELSNVLAELQFIPSISKYVMESTIIFGALFISVVQFSIYDSKHAVATLAVFLAAGTRVAPAALRIQQGFLFIKTSQGAAGPTLDLIEELSQVKGIPETEDSLEINHNNFDPNVEISEVSFTYPGSPSPAVSNINLKIKAGQSLAIVGPSGAGKTTLVDLILGVISPDSGIVNISGNNPLASITKWPGAMAYMPQDIYIINGSIRENVSLGFPNEVGTDKLVDRALEIAELKEFAHGLKDGIDTQIGERGTMLSGGQRQRLGIARTMFTNPRLLVLDESTSSLDSLTEALITEAILSLHGSVTVIMIAHRLSTIKNVDLLVYMENGKIISSGSFETIIKQVPDFEKQIKLMKF